MKQQLLELSSPGQTYHEYQQIDINQIKSKSNTQSPRKYENNTLNGQSMSSQFRDNTLNNTQKNDSESYKRAMRDSKSEWKKQTNQNPNVKRIDKLKLKIVCIILFSLIFGIMFTGVMNYFLAILLTDHISETTTEEIGKVQIDFTRSMGLHYGNAYVNLIQQETDKTLKLYNQLLYIIKSWAVGGSYNDKTIHDSFIPKGAPVTCPYPKTMQRMVWKKNDKKSLTQLNPFDQEIFKKLFSMFITFRAISTDSDLKLMQINLINDYQVSYPPSTLEITYDEQQKKKYVGLFNLKNRMHLQYSMTNQDVCRGDKLIKLDIIFVTQCIFIDCATLGLYSSPICTGGQNQDQELCTKKEGYCGVVCTKYAKASLGFLKSLEGKGINSVFINQRDQNFNEKQIYTPFIYFNFGEMKVEENFWKNMFGVDSYNQSEDAQVFYNKFNMYYSNVDGDYLASNSFKIKDEGYQISIFSIKQKLPNDLKADGKQYIYFQYFYYSMIEIQKIINFFG